MGGQEVVYGRLYYRRLSYWRLFFRRLFYGIFVLPEAGLWELGDKYRGRKADTRAKSQYIGQIDGSEFCLEAVQSTTRHSNHLIDSTDILTTFVSLFIFETLNTRGSFAQGGVATSTVTIEQETLTDLLRNHTVFWLL